MIKLSCVAIALGLCAGLSIAVFRPYGGFDAAKARAEFARSIGVNSHG